jgi:AraC-like DNA-binding protein
MDMDIQRNLELFEELISCGSNIYTWCYSPEGRLLHSNCPDEVLFDTAFALFGCKDKALHLGRQEGGPHVLGTAFGLIWGVDFEFDNDVFRKLHVIGPAVIYDLSVRDIEYGLQQYSDLEVSLSWKHQFLTALNRIPVAQNIVFSRYLLMLHYCLTGEKLDAGALNMNRALDIVSGTGRKRDRHKVWQAERAMLQMVRNGDLNYRSILNTSVLISSGVPVRGNDPLRQPKTSTVVFISIVCRAAIEGGLSPEEAYSLGDSYIQAAENAKTFDEVATIAITMYDDFVRRVNRCRMDPKLSPPVQKCCDYIKMNLNQKLKANDLASLAGYTEYYFTYRFKKETGCSINDYVKRAKIDRAKILLQSTSLSVQETSDELCFGTRSYFCRVFRAIEGCTPVEFRNREQS